MRASNAKSVESQPSTGSEASLSQAEFARLFEQSHRTLWCVSAAILGNRDDVEDVLQDAAVIALRKLGDFDPATSFTSWMAQIVRYVALNAGRRRARRRSIGRIDEEQIEEPRSASLERNGPLVANPGELARYRESFDDRVLAALNTLDDNVRTCLLLRTIEEMPYRDISELLGIPEGTAMSHVHRARRTLREQLSASEANSRTEERS